MVFPRFDILSPMYQGKRIGALLLMGGCGQRFGAETPKQFLPLGDKKVFEYSLDTLLSLPLFDEILLVCHPEHLLTHKVPVIAGGETRQESSYRGLKGFRQKPDIVLIHDAVRPFAAAQIFQENVEKALEFGAVNTCIPSADTLVYAPGPVVSQIPPRKNYQRGQTPQTFLYDWILEAHEKALQEGITDATDDCQLLLRLGKPIHIVAGSEQNFKITTPFDLEIAEFLLNKILN